MIRAWVILSVVTGLVQAPAARADELSVLVAGELARLNALYGTSARANIQPEGVTDSTADGQVTICRAEMSQIAQQASARNLAEIEKFVLGHEMVHQYQFLTYGRDVLERGIDWRRVVECQADMLAAANLLSAGPVNKDRVAGLEDVLRVAFLVGTENYAWQDHPDHEQRRLAVRLGLSLGLMKAMKQLPDAERNRDLENEIVRKIDLHPGDSDIDWSLRLSRRVVHFQREAVLALALGDADISWDTRAEHPFVTYSLPYTNTSDQHLHLELEIVSAMVPRFSRSNTAKWDRFDVKNYTLDLDPRETRVLSGQLQWYADADSMPRILYPPETQTLFSASFVGASVSPGSSAPGAPGFAQAAPPRSRADLLLLLKRMANQSPNCFKELQATTIAERLDLGDGDYADLFPTNVQLPGVNDLKIWRETNGSCRISGVVHRGRSRNGAIEAYTAFRDNLSVALGTTARERITGTDRLPRASITIVNGWEATLSISLRARSGEYTVRFGVDKSD